MSSICPACHERESEFVETVPVRALASAWAKEKTHSDDISIERLNEYIVADLGATEVSFRKCRRCGLEIATPMRSWSASHYPRTKHVLGFDHQATLAVLAKLPPLRILDIGCADCQFLEAAKAMGHETTGIDFTADDIRSAQARSIDARVADVSEIGQTFAGESPFDMITLFQIIEHLNQPDEIFSQIAAVAKQDARLVVGCPSDLRYTRLYHHPNRIKRSDYWDYPPQHTLRWTANAIQQFLARHGWSVEQLSYEPLLVVGAAAHMTELHAIENSWPRRDWRKRTAALGWIVRTAISRLFGRTTGIRQVVFARRSTTLKI